MNLNNSRLHNNNFLETNIKIGILKSDISDPFAVFIFLRL